jgi:hypothetical protein
MWHDAGVPDSIIRIQSGVYTSPAFHLTARPEMIALPYPAPYPAGAGVITLRGASPAVNVQFAPGLISASLAGTMPLSVFWDTGTPCR